MSAWRAGVVCVNSRSHLSNNYFQSNQFKNTFFESIHITEWARAGRGLMRQMKPRNKNLIKNCHRAVQSENEMRWGPSNEIKSPAAVLLPLSSIIANMGLWASLFHFFHPHHRHRVYCWMKRSLWVTSARKTDQRHTHTGWDGGGDGVGDASGAPWSVNDPLLVRRIHVYAVQYSQLMALLFSLNENLMNNKKKNKPRNPALSVHSLIY